MNEVLKKSQLQNDTKIQYREPEKKLMQYLDVHPFITLKTFMKISGLNKFSAARRLIKLVLANVLQLEPSESEDKFYVKELSWKFTFSSHI